MAASTQATSQMRQRQSDLFRSDEQPDVGVPRLAKHLAE